MFAGAGNYADATRNALNAQKQWYGYPDGNAAVPSARSRARSFPALAATRPAPNHARAARRLLQARHAVLGGAGGAISHILHGADVTINDPTRAGA